MYTGKPFTPDEIAMIESIPMNFILAKERSGTTLLQVMLNAHPKVIAPPESRFIVLLYYKYGKAKKWTEKLIAEFCDDLFKEGLFRNFWGINKGELQTVLLSRKESLTFPIVCKIIFYLSSPQKKGINIFFDKNPIYYFFLQELRIIFPEAKYIHLVRDYRAYLVSYKRVFANRKQEYSLKSSKEIVYRWLKVNRIIEELEKLSPENYYMLTYEALVQNPEQKMKDLCHFLNLTFDERMVENHWSGIFDKFNNNKTDRFREIHEELFRPINPVLSDEWKERITDKELQDAESIAGTYGESKYGYKRTYTPKNNNSWQLFAMKVKYNMVRFLCRKIYANLGLYYIVKRRIWRNF